VIFGAIFILFSGFDLLHYQRSYLAVGFKLIPQLDGWITQLNNHRSTGISHLTFEPRTLTD
jgi:hypothetical protein